jgi:tRNA nucleotidyltransferase/poly(A) polymerase
MVLCMARFKWYKYFLIRTTGRQYLIEDPVRILRVARFAAQFKAFGFKVAHKTHQLMKDMVVSGEVDALTPELVRRQII